MTFPQGSSLYSQSAGIVPAGLLNVLVLTSPPTSSTIYGPAGQLLVGQRALVINTSIWELIGFTSSSTGLSANWVEIATSSGGVLSIIGTANEITASSPTGNVTLSVPSTFIAPGSIAATTTVTAGTGITATTGNIAASSGNITASGTVTGGTGLIATTGNLTLSGTGSGLVTTPTVGTPGAGPITANGRVFSATFSSISIASGATQVLVISNTSITGSGTLVSLTWSGATAGSALSIASAVPTANTLTITMTNGTSATMVTSIANITFTGIVLN